MSYKIVKNTSYLTVSGYHKAASSDEVREGNSEQHKQRKIKTNPVHREWP